MESLYCIRINRNYTTPKYISYCDECWYETSNIPQYKYTLDEAKDITKNMDKHYIYNMDIIDQKQNIIENVNLLPTLDLSIHSPVASIKIKAIEKATFVKNKPKGNSMSSILKCFANIK